MEDISYLQNLVEAIGQLPGVGNKTAKRYAYNILDMPYDNAVEIANSIMEARDNIHFCKVCGNYTEKEVCSICENRDNSVICVVAYVKDLLAIEQYKLYKGVYHVLNGVLNPIKNIGPRNIKIAELLARIDDSVKEVILAIGTTPEGNATAQYIADELKERNVKVTCLAQGLPLGSDIEYADGYTLQVAINKRIDLKNE